MVGRRGQSRSIQERCLFSVVNGAEHSRWDQTEEKPMGGFSKRHSSCHKDFRSPLNPLRQLKVMSYSERAGWGCNKDAVWRHQHLLLHWAQAGEAACKMLQCLSRAPFLPQPGLVWDLSAQSLPLFKTHRNCGCGDSSSVYGCNRGAGRVSEFPQCCCSPFMQIVVQFLSCVGLSLAWHVSPSTVEHIKVAFSIRIFLKSLYATLAWLQVG